MNLKEAEDLAERTYAAIDRGTLSSLQAADRKRVKSDLDGLRRVEFVRGTIPDWYADELVQGFTNGLKRTAKLYGVIDA